MKNIILVIKGFIMGIANIIPGVSGGTLALTMGIYENFIGAISHFFSNLKENIKFLLPIFIGIGLSLLTMSNVITASFDKYPIPTTLFFMGLVIGGIPMLFSKIKGTKEVKKPISYIIMLLTFLLVMVLAFSKEIFGGTLGNADFSNLNILGYLNLTLIGTIAAATMVIPGVSGSLVLMLLGYYFFNNYIAGLIVVIAVGINDMRVLSFKLFFGRLAILREQWMFLKFKDMYIYIIMILILIVLYYAGLCMSRKKEFLDVEVDKT